MNFDLVYKLIAISCLVSIFTNFEPVRNLLKKLLALDGKIYHLVYKVLSCSKCLGLWATLIITQDLYQAAIVSCLSIIISNQFNKL